MPTRRAENILSSFAAGRSGCGYDGVCRAKSKTAYRGLGAKTHPASRLSTARLSNWHKGKRPCATTECRRSRGSGKPRDPETGLDDFGARYNSSSLGRFLTPDPSPFSPRVLENPQRLNRYVYVIDNPVSRVDPDGLTDILFTVMRQQETSTATTGTYTLSFDNRIVSGGFTLERVWRENGLDSRVPAGLYDASRLDISHNGRLHWVVMELADAETKRGGIEVHSGVIYLNSAGCILAGEGACDQRLFNSRAAIVALRRLIDAQIAADKKSGQKTTLRVLIMDGPGVTDVETTGTGSPGANAPPAGAPSDPNAVFNYMDNLIQQGAAERSASQACSDKQGCGH